MSRDLKEAELAGKQFLSSFGRPFQLLSEGYDEWTLDKDGYLHREYRWDDPEIRVAIDLQRHEGRFLLSVSYDRATKLDTAPPARPDDPLKLHVSLGETKLLAPSRMHCVGEQVEPDELSAARELARRIERELAKSPEWIRIVPAEEADYVVLLGAHWEEREREGARRCVSADVELPGQHLGRAIIEGGPNWRELENMDTAAAALARGIAELFQEQYYRLLNQRPRDR
jgi:hypothetical protein